MSLTIGRAAKRPRAWRRFRDAMRITVTSVGADDQRKALRFYTEVLGFVPKADAPLGEYSWLTVVSPEDPDGTELLLEPDQHPAARPFKEALVADGIPAASFGVADVHAEHARLSALGVRFTLRADRRRPGDDRGARRHLRQPDPDRLGERLSAGGPAQRRGRELRHPVVERDLRAKPEHVAGAVGGGEDVAHVAEAVLAGDRGRRAAAPPSASAAAISPTVRGVPEATLNGPCGRPPLQREHVGPGDVARRGRSRAAGRRPRTPAARRPAASAERKIAATPAYGVSRGIRGP